MKQHFLIIKIIVVLLIMQPCSLFSQQDILSFVDRYFEKREGFESLTFDVAFEQKVYVTDDTVRNAATVELVRAPEDTIYNGFVFIQTPTKLYAYDGQRSFFGELPTSSLLINEIDKNPGINIKRDWASNLIETAFLTKDQRPKQAIRNPEFLTTVSDTVLGQWPCKGILTRVPDQEGFTNIAIYVAIDTIDYMLRQRVISMTFQENQQYQSWTFTNPVYGNQRKLTKLNEDLLSSFDHHEIFEYVKPDEFGEAEAIIDYSTLKGRILSSGKAFDIQQLDEQIIILDFWYSSCYPCIQSIPEVNKIYDRFQDKGVAVFGVNIVDDEIKNKNRIEKYARNNPMKYQTIMADPKKYSSWIPFGYPMLLILDSDFELIETHGGYSETMADEISKIIEEHLDR